MPKNWTYRIAYIGICKNAGSINVGTSTKIICKAHIIVEKSWDGETFAISLDLGHAVGN